MSSPLPRDEMLRAFAASDAAYDGVFLTAVRSTGIFCRPSCPAKKPSLQNVEFFATIREAMFAGYRPCKRCRPLEASGCESHSGFRDAFARAFGAPPGQEDRVDSVTLGWIESLLGPLIAGADDRGVCLLEFSDRRRVEAQLRTLRRRLGRALIPGEHAHLARLRAELAEYFDGRRREFQVPLHAPGTPFQERVWKELLRIPYGETRSYEQIARRIGAPKSVRAVGRANGMNRISIVIPCHRVVGKDGSLVGYGGGVHRKERLLDLERGVSPCVQLDLPVMGARVTARHRRPDDPPEASRF